MFISHIDNNSTFHEAVWVVSIISWPVEEDQTSKATIVIEGVINRRLLFGRYDVVVKVCEDSSDKKPRAYIDQIECFESSRYKGDFLQATSISYYATPKESQVLAQHIQQVAALFNKSSEDDNDVSPELIIYPATIEKACISWCFDLLSDHHILHRTGDLTKSAIPG